MTRPHSNSPLRSPATASVDRALLPSAVNSAAGSPKGPAVLSVAEAKDLLKREGKRSKYKAVPVVVDGVRFHSQGEATRWGQLKLLELAGKIHGLRRQHRFLLAIGGAPVLIKNTTGRTRRQASYTADFVYLENGKEIIEDYKGFLTSETALRIGVMEAIYGCEVRLTRAVRK